MIIEIKHKDVKKLVSNPLLNSVMYNTRKYSTTNAVKICKNLYKKKNYNSEKMYKIFLHSIF